MSLVFYEYEKDDELRQLKRHVKVARDSVEFWTKQVEKNKQHWCCWREVPAYYVEAEISLSQAEKLLARSLLRLEEATSVSVAS